MKKILLIPILFLLLLSACGQSQASQSAFEVVLFVDGQSQSVNLSPGSTVRDVYEAVGIELNQLDKSDPVFHTVIEDGMQVTLTRVIDEYYQEEEVIPFETQTLRNESLPEGERRLIQPGENGLREITYRRVLENGVEVSNTIVENVIINAAVPEIIMIGSQTPFAVIPIPGKLAYISGGNAWLMEENTGNRRPVVTIGDLDGRIFSLSPDGVWLLYSRSDEDEEIINTLWVTRVDGEEELTFELGVQNVIHFAEWIPNSINGLAFSTVEFNQSPPGWQANNDFFFLNFSVNGWVSQPRVILAGTSGGIYGWWGTNYIWSIEGEELVYVRPDGIGMVDFDLKEIDPFYDLIPLQTRSDWAWVPHVSWSPDGFYLYTVDHAPQEGLSSAEESSVFDLLVIPMFDSSPVALVSDVGMFASPITSPQFGLPTGDNGFYVAYLQAQNPTQSASSGYRLMLMDRDGSNQQALFPSEGGTGLVPQLVEWAPLPTEEGAVYQPIIAFIYQGNLWLYNVPGGQAQQITGDGLTDALDWE